MESSTTFSGTIKEEIDNQIPLLDALDLNETRPFLPQQDTYTMTAFLPSNYETAPDYTCASYFPWNESHCRSESDVSRWSKIVGQWRNVVAICGGSQIQLLRTGSTQPFVRIGAHNFEVGRRHPKEATEKFNSVIWAVDPRTRHPLVVAAGRGSVVYIWDVVARSTVGVLRGHGGPILSLCAHPIHPHIFASTSRDMSVRIYNLDLNSTDTLSERNWPITATSRVVNRHRSSKSTSWQSRATSSVSTSPALPETLAAPLGGSVPAGEGLGIGKCFAVLRGNITDGGGHRGPVLHACFHSTRNLIATCGVEHCVKIWMLPDLSCLDRTLTVVDDKPVFSATSIHISHVRSIQWLSEDVLISSSSGDEGTIVVWKWLELHRFFPLYPAKVVRVSGSDYKQSRSYTVIARTWAPPQAEGFHKLVLNRRRTGRSVSILLPTGPDEITVWTTAIIPTHGNDNPWRPEADAVPSKTRFRTESTRETGSGSDSDTTLKRRRLKRLSDSEESSQPDGAVGKEINEWNLASRVTLGQVLDGMPGDERRLWLAQMKRGILGIQSVTVSPDDGGFIFAVGKKGMMVLWKRSSGTVQPASQ